jgi:hypothetical protein
MQPCTDALIVKWEMATFELSQFCFLSFCMEQVIPLDIGVQYIYVVFGIAGKWGVVYEWISEESVGRTPKYEYASPPV